MPKTPCFFLKNTCWADVTVFLKTPSLISKKIAAKFDCFWKGSTEEAKEHDEKETLCFDFQQNLPFPHLPVGKTFCKTGLWFYNFCIHSCTFGKPVTKLGQNLLQNLVDQLLASLNQNQDTQSCKKISICFVIFAENKIIIARWWGCFLL